MKCPRCDTDLDEVKFQEIVIDQCRACAGIWFDFAELERILSRDAHAMRRLLPDEGLPPVPDVDILPCPRCDDTLIRMWIEPEHVRYYTCLTCYGRWLDGSEIQRIAGRSLAIKFERLFQLLLDHR